MKVILLRLPSLVILLRPLDWSKNAFVLLPAVFHDIPSILRDSVLLSSILLTTLIFCLLSSSIYIFNDISDISQDRLHPIKSRSRPLAAGRISVSSAWFMFAFLSAVSLLSSLFFLREVFPYFLAYWLLMIFYSIRLKHIVIVDLFVIALGFCLRVYAGSSALSIAPTTWMLSTTLCLALFLAASKRRQESLMNESLSRRVLHKYSVPLIERYMTISAVCALTFYSLFATSERAQLGLTIPFVLFGFFRYLYLLDSNMDKDSPTDFLFSDGILLLCVSSWLFACLALLWL